MIALLAIMALSVAPQTVDPRVLRTDGIDGLCTQVARTAAPQLGAAHLVALQVTAEGAALELGDAVTGRCTAILSTETLRVIPLAAGQSGTAERVIRIRMRAAPPVLVAMVEVVVPHADAKPEVLLAEAVDAPIGNALANWVNVGGTGLETWLAGTVGSEVLALCGDDGDGDGVAEIALVMPAAIEVMRWTVSGFEPITRVALPPGLRSRARVAGASVLCRSVDGGMTVAFGIHDRNRGGQFRVVAGQATPLTTIEGIPIGFGAAGELVLAEGVIGTDLLRWHGQPLASAVALGLTTGKDPRVFGVSQDGALFAGETTGRALLFGSSVAVAFLDRDGVAELVSTRPALPGGDENDRFVVSTIDNPAVVRHESSSLKGTLGPIGTVAVGTWSRVLAAQVSNGRTQLYAFGRRLPLAAR